MTCLWCNLPGTEFPEKWAEAITHYENALRVRRTDRDRQRYAATIMNFGTALRQSREGDRAANVLKAIHCYHAAWQVYHAHAAPGQVANVCNNPGNAFLACPARDRSTRLRHARYALHCFERSLQTWTLETDPYHYALAQYNRSCAFRQLAASPESAEHALACLENAYACAQARGYTDLARAAKAQADEMIAALRPDAIDGRK